MDKAATIAALNDHLRTTFDKAVGQIITTRGIAALPEKDQVAIFSLVREFNDFNAGNDPHGEHDFGKIEYEGREVFFKIDYYDTSLQWASPDPSDSSLTKRVMTIMLAHGY